MPAKGFKKCELCGGTRTALEGLDCSACQGTGWVGTGWVKGKTPPKLAPDTKIVCRECGGSGRSVDSAFISIACDACDGTGYATRRAAQEATMAEDSASAEDSPGWGWQDCYDRQKEWLDEALQHVPWPDETIIPSWEAPLPALREALQRITGSLTYLNANQGLLRGRSKALKDVFESAMSAAKGRIPANEKLTTEAAREGWVFNSDIGEALRDTRRRYIEIETCIISQDGLIRAYQAAWDGVSRMLSASLGEVELATSRTA